MPHQTKKTNNRCKIKLSEEIKDSILNLSPDLVCVIGMDGYFKYVNPAWEKLLGYTEKELLSKPILELIHPDDHTKNNEQLARLSKGEITKNFEIRIICKDSTIKYIQWTATPDIKEKTVYCTGRDITERKKAEKIFQDSDIRNKIYVKNAPLGIFVVNSKGKYIDVNPKACKLLGYTRNELLQLSISDVSNSKETIEIFQRLKEAGLVDCEIELKKKDGSIVNVLLDAVSLPKDQFMAFCTDITERKLTQEALKESERQFRRAITDSPVPIMIYNEDGNVLQLSKGWTDYSGYTIEDIPTVSAWTQKAYGSASGSKKKYIDKLFEIDKTVYNCELNITAKNGSKRIWEFRTTPIGKNSSGKRLLHSMAVDITKRKQMEEALLKNQKRYKKAQAMGHVGNWEYDPVTTKFWGSDEAKRIYGFELESPDFTTENVESCIPERERVHQALIDLLEHNKKYDLVFDIITADKGIRKTIHSIAEVESDAQGNVKKVTGVISDITEHKINEDKIKASLEEKEILLRELSHRTKNNMQVVSSMLRLYAKRESNEKIDLIFTEIEGKILSMALVHQLLYESKDLSHLNLNDYITKLIPLIKSSYLISNHIRFFCECEDINILIDTAAPLGLVINELISNSIKHAFPDNREGMIKINISTSRENELVIIISDDGIGFKDGFDIKKDINLGLKTVFNLVKNQLDGRIQVDSNNGLRWEIELKEEQYMPRL